MYDIEKIYQAKDVPDAIAALAAAPDAVVICGGSDVLVKIREGKLAGCSLVSIHGLKELAGVRMEDDGTIIRTVYPEVPPRVEYALSPLGESMRPILDAMEEWGTNYKKRMAGES